MQDAEFGNEAYVVIDDDDPAMVILRGDAR